MLEVDLEADDVGGEHAQRFGEQFLAGLVALEDDDGGLGHGPSRSLRSASGPPRAAPHRARRFRVAEAAGDEHACDGSRPPQDQCRDALESRDRRYRRARLRAAARRRAGRSAGAHRLRRRRGPRACCTRCSASRPAVRRCWSRWSRAIVFLEINVPRMIASLGGAACAYFVLVDLALAAAGRDGGWLGGALARRRCARWSATPALGSCWSSRRSAITVAITGVSLKKIIGWTIARLAALRPPASRARANAQPGRGARRQAGRTGLAARGVPPAGAAAARRARGRGDGTAAAAAAARRRAGDSASDATVVEPRPPVRFYDEEVDDDEYVLVDDEDSTTTSTTTIDDGRRRRGRRRRRRRGRRR